MAALFSNSGSYYLLYLYGQKHRHTITLGDYFGHAWMVMEAKSGVSLSLKHEQEQLTSDTPNVYSARPSSNSDSYDFSEPISCYNYKERFQKLLCLEEKERANQLEKRYYLLFC